MAKPRSIKNSSCDTASEDLRARLRFCSETRKIWLHEHRMQLIHAEAQATMRRELIDTLRLDRARGFFTRMGYAAGIHDAELARTRPDGEKFKNVFIARTQLG